MEFSLFLQLVMSIDVLPYVIISFVIYALVNIIGRIIY